MVRSRRLRLRPQRPAIPAGVRPAFALAGLAALSSWSIGGLALALGPGLTATLFQSSDHLIGGLSVLTLAGPAAISQLVFRNTPPWAAATAGWIALAVGLLGIVLAVRSHGVASFPDPTSSPPPPSSGNVLGLNGWYLALGTAQERQSPAYKQAAATCQLTPR